MQSRRFCSVTQRGCQVSRSPPPVQFPHPFASCPPVSSQCLSPSLFPHFFGASLVLCTPQHTLKLGHLQIFLQVLGLCVQSVALVNTLCSVARNMAAAAAMVASAGISAVMSSSSSSQSQLVKAAPSSLLVTAAIGNLRPSLQRNWSNRVQRIQTVNARLVTSSNLGNNDDETQQPNVVEESFFLQRALLTATATVTPFLLTAQDAYAAGGEYGILEGRILSLLHPVVMLGLFVATGYAGFLGWQWRRVRTIQEEITELKKQVPVAAEGQAMPSPIEGQIKELTEVRKALVKGGFKDRHFNWGSILLGSGVLFSVYGATNTYLRTGKLFPGPHLYVGVGITVLWALAASLVPPMQKGNDTARSLHIALNTVNLLLFAWQIPTGWEIVLKVLEFTKFP